MPANEIYGKAVAAFLAREMAHVASNHAICEYEPTAAWRCCAVVVLRAVLSSNYYVKLYYDIDTYVLNMVKIINWNPCITSLRGTYDNSVQFSF